MQNAQIVRDDFPNSARSDAAEALPSLKPALFARYGNLSKLRHDYPLVLVDSDEPQPLLRPLSTIVNEALRAAAPEGPDGEEVRMQVLKLEQRMRDRATGGREERLTQLWWACEAELVEEAGEARFGSLDQIFEKARRQIKVDGRVIGCDDTTPSKVLGHIWQAMHKNRARHFRKRVDSLILRMNDILKSDHMKSDEAHGAVALSSAMGLDRDGSIDFSSLSDVLHRLRPEDRLPADRVARINEAIEVLQSQVFFGPGRASYSDPGKAMCYSYVFKSCSEALAAYRERLPSLVALTKALTIAELEVENKYVPGLHDAIFASFDESDLTAEQMDLLPPAMIYLRDGVTETLEIARVYEALACGLPFKVMIQVDDILGPTTPEPPLNSFGAGTARLASMAMGLNNAFAIQTTSAHLYRMRDALLKGMEYGGPAMFSIYSGATHTVRDVAPYILAAAATEARAFPSFTFDPSAGPDWASRFNLDDNPQLDEVWPEHSLTFENQIGEWKEERVAFTFGDFAICDERYQRFCHAIAQSDWSTNMVPFADWLKVAGNTDDVRKPYVLGVFDQNRLMRVAVDDKITSAARLCQDAWRGLKELAGIDNSHVTAVLHEERLKREAFLKEMAEEEANQPSAPSAAQAPVSDAVSEAPKVEEAEDVASDPNADGTPWIETPRCTTCNECTQINNKLFAFNDDMQAYIADPDGGTYRQLVEAAESCQVSIIHPGKPRNPDEPNLDELVERAEPFN
ncbi:4Fe-4S single cluster domain of Ferredoxin I [Cohaesibacter sp. ES.047]|uniref:ferredoxin n=1 Tax=Cohaesibacter sp. ES.047 TaxID=1798205 RepID=UPI000BB86E25|nr:ferredoxin [Cohaesibacter sp. ES.047]SNY89970.1 4Fe-4S single cluster domain of Ferredoxin I [Cohaesibacter sp. ES.047]